MKRRIIALLVLTLVLLSSVSLIVFAEFRDVIPEGYKYPDEFFNLENGLSQEYFGPSKVSGVFMKYCVVRSDYIDRVLRKKICLANSQFDTGTELYDRWLQGGFFPTYETQNQTFSVTIERNSNNDGFTKYEGHFQAGGYIDGPEDSNGFFKRVGSFTSEVVLNISNVVYKNYRIYMDIDGYVQYQYGIYGDIQGSPPVAGRKRTLQHSKNSKNQSRTVKCSQTQSANSAHLVQNQNFILVRTEKPSSS